MLCRVFLKRVKRSVRCQLEKQDITTVKVFTSGQYLTSDSYINNLI